MNMKKFLAYWVLFFLFVAVNLSCVIRVVDYQDPRGVIPVGDFLRNIPFSPGGDVTLKNFDGNIEVTGWERNEVEVYAEKMIPRTGESQVRFMMPRRGIAKIDLERYTDENIYINTKSISKEGENTIVDYFIKTPRYIDLRSILARKGDIFIADIYGSVFVRLEQGNIHVDNFSGSLDASVNNGHIKASLYDERKEDKVNLKSLQGDITLFLQKKINAQIKAVFPGGEINSEFDLGPQEKENEVDLKLGEGGAFIYITALSGNIDIKVIGSE